MGINFKKVNIGSNDYKMVQTVRNPHSKNQGGKTKMTIRYLYYENIVSRVSSYFQTGGHSVTRTKLHVKIKKIYMKIFKKVQVGNVHEKAQSGRNSHSKKPGGKVYMGNRLALMSGKHVREMYTPSYPVLYSKTWVYRGIPIFIILLQT